jgi:hypothetical protein
LIQNQFTFEQYTDGFMYCNLLPTGHKVTLACQLSIAQISGSATERSVLETHVSRSRLDSQRPVGLFTISFQPVFSLIAVQKIK